MNFAERYANFMETQRRKFPGWIVQDHGAGGHVEMMKDVTAKDGSNVMVFFWNAESAHIARHPRDIKRYVALKEWNEPDINITVLDNQEKYWISLMYNDDKKINIYPEAEEVFDYETIQSFKNIFKGLKELSNRWDEESAVEKRLRELKESAVSKEELAKMEALILKEIQQKRFPNWIIRDGRGVGEVEMMKDVATKDGRKILVVILNDENASVFFPSLDKKQYITLEDWNQQVKGWEVPFIYQNNVQIGIYHEAYKLFDDRTIQEFVDIFGELKTLNNLRESDLQFESPFTDEKIADNAYSVGESQVEVGDIVIINHETIYRVIQADFDCAERKYGLLNLKTNKVELRSQELDFKQGDEIFGPEDGDIITAILKEETYKLIKGI